MFDQTFVDGAGKTNQGWTVALSLALECLVVGVMIVIPLIWIGVLPKPTQWSMLTVPATPPPPPPPARPVRKVVSVVHRQMIGTILHAPPAIPAHIAVLDEDPQALLGNGDSLVSLDGGGLSISLGNAGPGIGNAPLQVSAPNPNPLPAPKEPPINPEPLRQSSGVQAAKCVSCPKPAYPPFARQARIQGAIVLSAVIAKDGTVQKVTLVSSANPLLTKAASDAVAKWIYSPTILDKQPVEVVTEITISFALQ